MKIDLLERVTINPEQCGGRPCIRNLRMRVCDILSLLGYWRIIHFYKKRIFGHPFYMRRNG